MAEVFRRVQYLLTANSSLDAVYTTPTSTTTILMNAHVANKDLTEPADLTAILQGYQSSNTYLARNITIPVGAALNFLSGKVVMQGNDSIRVGASANSYLDLTLSLLEITS
jgi:TATA-box binding protein (TBP) (component of TFIID and TFIIIB)